MFSRIDFRNWLPVIAVFSIVPVAAAQTNSFVTVSAASYQTAVAPSSIATIFGSGLAASTAPATLDSSGRLPTSLAGTTVEVNAEAAGLLYVSQSQINFVVPDDTPTGLVDIVIRTAVGSTLAGSVHVGDTAPGLFSSDASGTGPGAILNAVTFQPGPFLVETAANTGSDKRTRLAVYATGIRWAGNPSHDASIPNAAGVTLSAHDSSGNSYTVEFAGAAPGFFGLDQLNIVLPPQMDGAGTVSLVVSTDTGGSSNTVTFQVNSLPASAIHLTGLTLSPAFVMGGDKVQATVSLNGRAPLGGINTSIQSTNSAAQVPFSTNIPAGTSSTQFTFGTLPVMNLQTATVTAQAGGVSQTATLEIDPTGAAQLRSFSVTPASVQGGRNLSATLSLSAAAPLNGATITLASDNAAVPVPATVPVPFGQQSTTLSIPTSLVSAAQTANLTASFGHVTQTAAVTVNPPFTLVLSSNSVLGGNTVAGTVTLFDLPAAPSSVMLRSSDTSAQIQPLSVPMLPNQQSATFMVTTSPVSASKSATISATSSLFSGITQTAALSINPPGTAQLQSLTLTPDVVTGGQKASGVVTLSAPAPINGVVVNLKTSDVQHAQLVQQFLILPSGQTAGSFAITTSPVTATQTVTVTATAQGVSKSATLKVQ